MVKVLGVTDDSRKVQPGWAFVAIKGITVDGHDYIDQAIKNGASVIYGEAQINAQNYVRVSDSRQKLGELAAEFYGSPSSKLKVIGVTGTDGKTTTSSLIYHILKESGKKVGLISTVSAKIGSSEYDTGFHVTNPDPILLNKFLSEMVEKGMEFAVIEVTSHGIEQKRIAGINFEVCVITNITKEHLDYHKTFDNYRNIKLSFLKQAKSFCVINKDDSSFNFLKSSLANKWLYYQRTPQFKGILPGIYNESNAAAAVKVVEQFGVSNQTAFEAIKSFKFPEGRLEEMENKLGIKIYVDFAHTPNALENVLTYLRGKTNGRLISVFGCASERDIKKRPAMARISAKIADVSIFTVEDSRHEDIYNIFRPMAAAAKRLGKKMDQDFFEIPERGEAIAFAISKALPGDCVVICGKGHEKSLAYKGYEHPWSDQVSVRNYLNADPGVAAIILAAGKGTRMNSKYPKVIHEICGRPMIVYTLNNLRSAGVAEIIPVVSYRKSLVIRKIKGMVKIAHQLNPKGGTADAATAGYKLVSSNCKTLIVINGDDSAFYTPETINKILTIHKQRERKLTFVSLIKDNPTGLGRVIRGKNGLITKIVEEKDATPEERQIKEVNDGLYVFDRKWFSENITKVKKSPQGEYYLVDLIKMAIDKGDRMATYTLPNDDEWQGVNNPEQLSLANEKMALKLRA